MSTTPDPTWRRPEVEAVADQLQRLADFDAGTDAVRARVRDYLPQLERESDRYYAMRSTAVAVPGYLSRTLGASIGRIVAVAPTLDPAGLARVADDWQDLDGMGTHGDVVLARAGRLAIRDGYALVLVDAPVAPAPVVSLAEADRTRPRWITYTRAQLLNWRVAPLDGRLVVTMVALAEDTDVDDGAFAMTRAPRVRVLRRDPAGGVTAEVWAEVRTGSETHWARVEGPYGYPQQTEIPLAVLAAAPVSAPFVAAPPLLPLCDAVIEWWQVACDMRHNERMACFPQPVVVGPLAMQPDGTPGRLTLGPTSAVQLEPGGSFSWAELSGDSLEQLRAGQADRLRTIGALGLSFLVTETRAAETARAKALDAAAENATLADAARGLEDGANVALAFHARYFGIDDAPTVSLNKNLSGETIGADVLRELRELRRAGELSRGELRELLARGRVIPAEMATEAAVQQAETEAAVDAAIRESLRRTEDAEVVA
jgi:hypothetical protein